MLDHISLLQVSREYLFLDLVVPVKIYAFDHLYTFFGYNTCLFICYSEIAVNTKRFKNTGNFVDHMIYAINVAKFK